jgi:hypothetical protein
MISKFYFFTAYSFFWIFGELLLIFFVFALAIADTKVVRKRASIKRKKNDYKKENIDARQGFFLCL